jgi:hypothetical protein
LRVLITNNTLDNRAGSELYVRDLALALLERGHTPIAYSTRLGEVARELRAATAPVIDDLNALSSPPDVIHGHHHIETMTALLRFPVAPAIFVCHGWAPWEETPPRFPRIRRYVAVDNTCRDRLVCESAIPEDRIRVLLNFVDLQRFKPRGALPPRPERALVFSNNANERTHLGVIREACQRSGVQLDVMGLNSGNPHAQPEEVIGGYDMIFAKARAAIEAMAVGAAVVLCDSSGAGPMVTTKNLDQLRPLNFGIRALREPLTPDWLAQEIARYDPADAAEVSSRIRATAGREAAIDEIIAMYQEVIAEQASQGETDWTAEEREASNHLVLLRLRLRELERQYDQLRLDYERLKVDHNQSQFERDSLSNELDVLKNSVAFQLRERLLNSPKLAAMYRILARRPDV